MLDPERQLALHYVKPARRPAVETLWQLDAVLGAVLVTGREPMISRIRLTWWREALERLDHAPPPSEPMLEAAAQHLLGAGLTGQELAQLERGWDVLIDPGALGEADLQAYAGRGAILFALTARILGGEIDPDDLAAAGRSWALVDLARRTSDGDEAAQALALARRSEIAVRWPVALRSLGMVYQLAAGDARQAGPLARAGSPARLLRMISHRLTGR